MDIVRDQLLSGRFELPGYKKFVTAIGSDYAKLADDLVKALWYQYLRNKSSINGPYWADKFNNPKVFNLVIMSLSKGDWVTSHSIPSRNWSEIAINERKLLEFVTEKELQRIRAYHKFTQYVPKIEESTLSTKVRVNGRIKETGIKRLGFMAAGNTRFMYDTLKIEEYFDPIAKNLTKSMDKLAKIYPEMRSDLASYDTINIEILEYMMETDEVYSRGDNYCDSRGRAISSVLGKVANPLSDKDFRALLIIPKG